MSNISLSLKNFPRISLDSMQWENEASIQKYNRQSAATNKITVKGNPGSRYQIITIAGHVNKFNGDYRTAQALIARFTRGLTKSRKYFHVQALKMPVNTQSHKSLSGNTGKEGDDQKAIFSLILIKYLIKRPSRGAIAYE